MAGRGPLPTPTAVLKARGSKLVSQRVEEPQFDGIAPDPMWDLTEKQRQVWDYTVPLLLASRVLTVADRVDVTRYCVLVAMCPDEKDTDKLLRLNGAINQLSDRFGLNPAARSRVKSAAAPTKTKARFFSGPRLAQA